MREEKREKIWEISFLSKRKWTKVRENKRK